MTNNEKSELRQLCREGLSFKEIRELVNCAGSTIKRYMKVFNKENDVQSDSFEGTI